MALLPFFLEPMLRFTTAGESHGPALISILEGMVAGLSLTTADIDVELARRQQGYGRGRRMKIESDHAELLSGVRRQDAGLSDRHDDSRIATGRTGGRSDPFRPAKVILSESARLRPRPGHVDLSGCSVTIAMTPGRAGARPPARQRRAWPQGPFAGVFCANSALPSEATLCTWRRRRQAAGQDAPQISTCRRRASPLRTLDGDAEKR